MADIDITTFVEEIRNEENPFLVGLHLCRSLDFDPFRFLELAGSAEFKQIAEDLGYFPADLEYYAFSAMYHNIEDVARHITGDHMERLSHVFTPMRKREASIMSMYFRAEGWTEICQVFQLSTQAQRAFLDEQSCPYRLIRIAAIHAKKRQQIDRLWTLSLNQIPVFEIANITGKDVDEVWFILSGFESVGTGLSGGDSAWKGV